MDIKFLDDAQKAIIRQLLSERAFLCEEWVRFWDYDKVQLDGNYTLDDLEFLIEAMKRMKSK